MQDPVHVIALDGFILSQLNHLQATLGDAVFNSLMQTVDCEVVQQLQLFLKHWLHWLIRLVFHVLAVEMWIM